MSSFSPEVKRWRRLERSKTLCLVACGAANGGFGFVLCLLATLTPEVLALQPSHSAAPLLSRRRILPRIRSHSHSAPKRGNLQRSKRETPSGFFDSYRFNAATSPLLLYSAVMADPSSPFIQPMLPMHGCTMFLTCPSPPLHCSSNLRMPPLSGLCCLSPISCQDFERRCSRFAFCCTVEVRTSCYH